MRIRWTDPAVQDLSDICDYLDKRATPETSLRVAKELFEIATSLNTLPHRGRPGRRAGTRELICTDLPYIIIYRVRENTVEIARILHGAQNWSWFWARFAAA
jgi:toxin ParE1/3/4